MQVLHTCAQGAKGAKSWEKAEDPIYALEHGLPIDCQHYLDHFLEKPLSRLFGPIMKNPKDLMSGAAPPACLPGCGIPCCAMVQRSLVCQ